MKYMKKLMALFAALTLALAMAVPAFAESGTASSSKGTITIDNAVTGTTYKAYRIFDLESYDTEKNAYSYKLNPAWSGFTAYSTTIDGNTVSAADFFSVNSAGYIEWQDAKKDAGANFAKLAKAFAVEKNIACDKTETATGTTVKFTDLTLGYYLVDTSLGSLCSLDTTAPSVTIKEKNSDTTIEKKIVAAGGGMVDSNSAGIGDTVNFSITITVKDGDPKGYVLHDKLSGLTFNPDSLEVKIGTTTLTADTDYTLDTNPADKDSFDVKFAKGILKTNDVVVVTYSAKVAADAAIAGAGNTNKANLEYNGKHSTEEETTTYVWKLNVHKYALDNANREVALSGAKFVLYRKNPTSQDQEEYATINDNNEITGWVTGKNNATTLETSGEGDILIKGLNEGTYYLEETEAPTGYNKLTEPIEVEITATASSTSVSEAVKYKNLSEPSYTPATDATVKVLNKAGTQLPSTGGIGTTLFYVIGGGLMAVAAVLLVAKKRMNNK